MTYVENILTLAAAAAAARLILAVLNTCISVASVVIETQHAAKMAELAKRRLSHTCSGCCC